MLTPLNRAGSRGPAEKVNAECQASNWTARNPATRSRGFSHQRRILSDGCGPGLRVAVAAPALPGSALLRSLAVLSLATKEVFSSGAMKDGAIHDRMPVILAPADYARWLSEETDPRDLMRPSRLI
jgi:hypothetical protein